MLRRLAFLLIALLSFAQFPGTMLLAQEKPYAEGDPIVFVGSMIALRDQPSESARPIVNVGGGSHGQIVDGESVSAEDSTWWFVEHLGSGQQGWVEESAFMALQADEATASPAAATPSAIDETVSAVDTSGCWPEEASLDPVSGASQWSSLPEMVIEPEIFDYYVTLSTDAGDIQIALLDDFAPTAANNFVCLAGAGFYDGSVFHRVFEGEFIQGGDPSGTGLGGSGYVFEESLPEHYLAGDVAMATNAPDANGSQFFIAISDLAEATPLDYPVFGRVVNGLEVVDSISQGQVEPDLRGENSAPIEPVAINSAEVVALPPRIGPPDPHDFSESTRIIDSDGSTAIGIEMENGSCSVDEIRIPADTDVTMLVTNLGIENHTFDIEELRISRTVLPGEEERVGLNTETGTYEFSCSLTDHRDEGTSGVLIVAAGNAAAPSEEANPGPDVESSEEAIVITAKDIFFEPDELTAQALQPQVITLVNEGAVDHNLTIDELGVDVDVAPGETATTFILAPPGDYEFYCNVPGHREAGMVGVLHVEIDTSVVEESSQDNPTGCDGSEEYQTAFDEAILTGLFSDPTAVSVILSLEDVDLENGDFSQLTPEEWNQLASAFDAVAVELDMVDPPAFAAAWHESQVETVRFMGEMFRQLGNDASEDELFPLSLEVFRLNEANAVALEAAVTECPEFRTWALESGITLD